MPHTRTDLPFFTAAHADFAERFRPWVSEQLTRFEESEGGDGRHAREIFGLLGTNGWLDHAVGDRRARGVHVPDLRTVCLMREALAYSSAIADVAFSEPWLAVLPILLFGDERQRGCHIPRFCTATELLAFALSEPDAGSDAAAITTTATPCPQGYVLEGRKTWTSNAGSADRYVVFARTDGAAGKDGISAVLAPGDSPEVVLERRLRVLSPHTVGTLAFKASRAPELVGAPGDGYRIAMTALRWFRPTVAAACVGFARRALDEAVARSKRRAAFGRPIAEHQITQAKLAEMAVKVDAASLLTYHAAWVADTRIDGTEESASVAKLYASEAAAQVVDEAVQLFGGMGVTHGTPVERLYRHVRAFRLFDGTSEIQKLIIAKAVLKR